MNHSALNRVEDPELLEKGFKSWVKTSEMEMDSTKQVKSHEISGQISANSGPGD